MGVYALFTGNSCTHRIHSIKLQKYYYTCPDIYTQCHRSYEDLRARATASPPHRPMI